MLSKKDLINISAVAAKTRDESDRFERYGVYKFLEELWYTVLDEKQKEHFDYKFDAFISAGEEKHKKNLGII